MLIEAKLTGRNRATCGLNFGFLINSKNKFAIRNRNPSKTWSVMVVPLVKMVTSRSIRVEISDVKSQTKACKYIRHPAHTIK